MECLSRLDIKKYVLLLLDAVGWVIGMASCLYDACFDTVPKSLLLGTSLTRSKCAETGRFNKNLE